MTQRAALKPSKSQITFRVLHELPERRRDVALGRARDLDDGLLLLGMVALGPAAREGRGHDVFLFD